MTADMKIKLQLSLSKALGLAPEELKISDVEEQKAGTHGGNGLKIIAMFNRRTSTRFKEAIQKGYDLEKQVLLRNFDPLPGFPIYRLVMEEVFHCGDDV